MALVVKDRVQETSSTTGTGTLTLDGAVSGFQTFSSAVGNGNTTYYAIVGGADWEVGIGTVGAGTLSRDTILESSNSGSAVNFSAGSKAVFVTYPAEKSVDTDTAQNLTNKTIDSSPIGATTPSTGAFTSVTTPSVTATTNNLTLSSLSTGSVVVNQGANGATGLVLSNSALSTASARLFFQNSNGTTSISNVAGNAMEFRTNATIGTTSGWEQFRVANTSSAVNYVQVTGSATGANPAISVQGSDATRGLQIQTKGSGALTFASYSGSNIQFAVNGANTAVNYLQVAGSGANQEPLLSAQGSDTNINIGLQSKGTGSIDLASGSTGVNVSNGTTVTAITGTAIGSNYTSIPSVAISAPNIAGGVQATADARMGLWGSTIVSGGTGYTVNDVLTVTGGTFLGGTAQQLRVTAVSGGVITAVTAVNFPTYTVLPTNPVSVTGGTGTGATFNLTWSVYSFNITNAGSGYTSQPTVTFSGGGGSGASAYATVGGNTIIKTLGTNLDFYTPSSITGSIPSFRINDAGAVAVDSYLMARPANGYTMLLAQGTTNANMGIYANGSGRISLGTNSTAQVEQFRVAHTASAVNYLQVTGGATGNPSQVVLTAQGSDANVHFVYRSRGTGNHILQNASGMWLFRTSNPTGTLVNYPMAFPSIAGSPSGFQVEGSDTNIDLSLVPKGTGKVVITNGLQGGTF